MVARGRGFDSPHLHEPVRLSCSTRTSCARQQRERLTGQRPSLVRRAAYPPVPGSTTWQSSNVSEALRRVPTLSPGGDSQRKTRTACQTGRQRGPWSEPDSSITSGSSSSPPLPFGEYTSTRGKGHVEDRLLPLKETGPRQISRADPGVTPYRGAAEAVVWGFRRRLRSVDKGQRWMALEDQFDYGSSRWPDV